jgi:hypothetical protein
MKLSQNNTSYNTTIQSAAEFGINDNDMSHIMGILRSQIYSDKLMAVIREYSTNAVDANVEAGKPSTPITVHLPTSAEPYITFRDFGSGLTPDEITQLYVRYGASTKRNSNDYTGCLGIGCKAGFAYGDTFTITSYTNDAITTWVARIDESKRGTVSMLHAEQNIDQPTGTEIKVSIQKSDIDTCVNKALNLFKFWSVKPNINLNHRELNILEETDEWMILDTSNESGYHFHNAAKVLMGNIIYPIDRDQIRTTNIATQLLLSRAVVIKAPLGALDIAANRESLEYSDRTFSSLDAMANNMLLDLSNNLNKEIKSAATRLIASINATKYKNIFEYNINNAILNNCNWQGQSLIYNIEFEDACAVTHGRTRCYRSNANDKYRNQRTKDVRSTTLNKDMTICAWDDSAYPESNATRRVRTLQEANNWDPNDIFVVIAKSDLDKVKPALTADDYTDLDNVKPLKAARSSITTSANGKTKSVRINVCKLQPATLKSSRLSEESEPTINEDINKYIYVPLDRFDWQDHPARLDNLGSILDAIKIITGKTPVINGVKKHYVKKLDTQWITLDDYYKQIFDKYVSDNPAHMMLALDATSEFDYTIDWNWQLRPLLIDVDNKKVSYLAKVLHYKESSRNHEHTKICNIAYLLGAIQRSSFIANEMRVINAIYPLMGSIHSITMHNRDRDLIIADINKLLA